MLGDETMDLPCDIDPNSHEGKVAIDIISVYKSLFSLVGGDSGQIKHWMHTINKELSDTPANKIKSKDGLKLVLDYLYYASRES